MRSARWQSIVDLPIVAYRGLRHHRGNREGVPIFIGRGAPLRNYAIATRNPPFSRCWPPLTERLTISMDDGKELSAVSP